MPIFFKKTKSFQKMKKELSRKYPLQSSSLYLATEKNLVSVILPVYNCEKYLAESISSVLSQTYEKLELIIVDDGSTDASGTIADNLAAGDERVRVIHQKNMKLPGALNTGTSAAKGEFLTWTSADNRMLPRCLEILVSELVQNRDFDMVFGNMRLIDEKGDILRGKGWYEIPPLSGNVILPDAADALNTVANNTIGAAFLYRSTAAKVIGAYDERFFTLEDYDFFMRMNYVFKIRHTLYKRPIYEYRFHKDSLTAHDEELEITSSRPKLMSFDEKRREGFLKPTYYFADGNGGDTDKLLSHLAHKIRTKEHLNHLLKNESNHIFYINFGNVPPSLDVPQGLPKFLMTDAPPDTPFGCDFLLCRDITAADSTVPVKAVAASSLAYYIILKTKSYFYQEIEF